MLDDKDLPLFADAKGKAFDVMYQQLDDEVRELKTDLENWRKYTGNSDTTLRTVSMESLIAEKEKTKTRMLATLRDVKSGKYKGFYDIRGAGD